MQSSEPTILLVATGERLAPALIERLGYHRAQVELASESTVVTSAFVVAPDVIVLAGDAARDGGAAILEKLGQQLTTSTIPVILVAESGVAGRIEGFRHGVVAVVDRTASADEMARKILQVTQELPERPGEATGALEAATIDEVVALFAQSLRAGVLSVSGEAGGPGAQVVLGGDRPLSRAIGELVERLKPMLRGNERLSYEFHESAPGRISGLDLEDDDAEAEGSSLRGVHLLVIQENAVRSDLLAQELRAAGAIVAVADGKGAGLELAHELAPDVVVVDGAGVEGWALEAIRAIHRDPLLRTAALLLTEEGTLWQNPRRPNVALLSGRIAALLTPDRELEARVRAEETVGMRLDLLGAVRLFRALARTELGLAVTITHPRLVAEVDLSDGLLAAATVRLPGAASPATEGPAALASVLGLSAGRVTIQRASTLRAANVMAPVDAAIAAADLERPIIPPSLPPPAPPPRASLPGPRGELPALVGKLEALLDELKTIEASEAPIEIPHAAAVPEVPAPMMEQLRRRARHSSTKMKAVGTPPSPIRPPPAARTTPGVALPASRLPPKATLPALAQPGAKLAGSAFGAPPAPLPPRKPEPSRTGLPAVKPEASRTGLPAVKPEASRTGLPAVAKPEGSRTGLPAVAKPEGSRTGLPAVAKPEASRTGLPAVVKPEGSRTGLPAVAKPEASRTGLPAVTERSQAGLPAAKGLPGMPAMGKPPPGPHKPTLVGMEAPIGARPPPPRRPEPPHKPTLVGMEAPVSAEPPAPDAPALPRAVRKATLVGLPSPVRAPASDPEPSTAVELEAPAHVEPRTPVGVNAPSQPESATPIDLPAPPSEEEGTPIDVEAPLPDEDATVPPPAGSLDHEIELPPAPPVPSLPSRSIVIDPSLGAPEPVTADVVLPEAAPTPAPRSVPPAPSAELTPVGPPPRAGWIVPALAAASVLLVAAGAGAYVLFTRPVEPIATALPVVTPAPIDPTAGAPSPAPSPAVVAPSGPAAIAPSEPAPPIAPSEPAAPTAVAPSEPAAPIAVAPSEPTAAPTAPLPATEPIEGRDEDLDLARFGITPAPAASRSTVARRARRLLDSASRHRARSELDAAERDFRAVLAMDPDNPRATAGMSIAASARGDHATALLFAQRLVRLRGYPNNWVFLGDAYLALGDTAAARRAFERALEEDPEHDEARARLGALPP